MDFETLILITSSYEFNGGNGKTMTLFGLDFIHGEKN